MNRILQKVAFLISASILLSSCTLGYFVKKEQGVTIVKDSSVNILIDKKEPQLKNGKYILPLDGEARQITIKREGYKSKNIVCIPNKLSPAAYGTIGINALTTGLILYTLISNSESGAPPVVFGAVGGIIGGIWGAGITSLSPQFLKYNSKINLISDSLLRIPTRDSLMREIKLNKVSVNLNPENSEYYYIAYDKYLKGDKPSKHVIKGSEPIKIDNTYFSDELNTLLKKNGFVDTSGLALKTSYDLNSFLNATIIGHKFVTVMNKNVFSTNLPITFINIKLKIKWDVLDYYKNVIFSDTIISKSDDFLASYTYTSTVGSLITTNNVGKSTYIEDAINDAIEVGLYSLMKSPKFKTYIALDAPIEKDTLTLMEINKASLYTTSIEQAAHATVTVKTKNGHGSGFFISEDGYIVTNYHNISDSSKLEIIMNDGLKYPAKIVRYDKTSDLALLKIEKRGIIPFDFTGLTQIVMGKEIFVIGTPSAEDLSQTLTKGIISSIRKQANGSKLIQTDASINLGNSGGPLIDREGNLLGIVNAKLVGFGVEGISFAIPAEAVGSSLKLLIK